MNPINNFSSPVLAVDSTQAPLRVALLCGEKVYRVSRRGVKQEEYLFPAVRALVEKAGIGLGDIKKVCVLRGPGRFTGIRIGLTFASMLHELNGADVYAETVFTALAKQTARTRDYTRWKKANPSGRIAVVLHAFRSEYFCQFFEPGRAEPRWLSLDELKAYLAAETAPLYVTGRGENGAVLNSLLPGFHHAPKSSSLLDTAVFARDCVMGNPAEVPVGPLYLKPARFEMTGSGR
ncbi:MAG: tRNA (adenosine(37)-N6)-threonylcarbamoyltransferase complex dimerization subunit type 1 TsaB [Elusimicrobiaceae bacterium]